MTKNALDARTAAEFAAAWLRGEARAEAEEKKAALSGMGKKAHALALEVPGMLAFMADQALIPPDEVDKYLLELDWTANPAVTERLLRYKKDPPKTAPAPKEKKAPTPSAKDDWTTEKLSDGTWKLKSYKGNDTVVHIPEVLGKARVSCLGKNMMSVYADRIRKEQIEVRRAIQEIYIPEGITIIENGAFCGCSMLTKVRIPNSVTKIFGNSFSGCSNLTIHAPAGSYAERYAKGNNIPFVAEE